MHQPANEPIRVKFLCRGPSQSSASLWLRQFPGQKGQWGRCQFIFDDNCQNYDWLVVYDDLHKQAEQLACPPQNTLLVTMEPSSVKTYTSGYLKQFGHVLTGQEDWALQHPGKIHSQPALHWFYGVSNTPVDSKDRIDFDVLNTSPPLQKSKVISTVCSNKQQQHTLHNLRFRFIEALQRRIPELDRFGRGVKDINDKAEALAPYKYHIAIENHQCEHWWTEKLADAFLGATLPFYFGAPNAAEYFPRDSFIPIDIRDLDASVATITQAIRNSEYERRLPAILEARRLVLERYNLFPTLAELIEQRHTHSTGTMQATTLYSRHGLRKAKPLTHLYDAWEKLSMQRQQKKHYPERYDAIYFPD